MIRPIAIGLAPNLELDDIFLAFKNVFLGKIFIKANSDLFKLNRWFKINLKQENIFLFNSGRSALFVALSSLDLKSTDEVIIQAFTCVAVPNAVIWAGGKPVFADISKQNLGMDVQDLEKKISSYTKAIIIQYTFGLPVDTDKIREIAKKYKLVVIEDCAHYLPMGAYKDFLGDLADFSVYSFGRDKAISSVFGGALSVNNKKYLKKIRSLYKNIPYPSKMWILKQHLHSILMIFILPLYNFLNIGKFLLFIFQKISLLTSPVYQEEKISKKPADFPAKMPAALAILVLNQLKKIKRFNKIRSFYVSKYKQFFSKNTIRTDGFPLLRYPLLIEERDKLIKRAKKEGIILGDWYSHIVDPKGVDLAKINYTTPCPNANYVAQYIINLPTYPTFSQKQFLKLISLFKKCSLRFK